MEEIWKLISDMDTFIDKNKPFKKIKEDLPGAHKDLKYLAGELSRLAISLYPFMPDTAAKIQECLTEAKIPTEPLFLRKE